jgi:hypothetical protein
LFALLGRICHGRTREASPHLVPPQMGGTARRLHGRATGGLRTAGAAGRTWEGTPGANPTKLTVRLPASRGPRFDTDRGRRLGYAPAELQGTYRVRLKFVSLCRITTCLRPRRPQPGRTSRGAAPR